jgi:Cytochrome c554 and c-prime
MLPRMLLAGFGVGLIAAAAYFWVRGFPPPQGELPADGRGGSETAKKPPATSMPSDAAEPVVIAGNAKHSPASDSARVADASETAASKTASSQSPAAKAVAVKSANAKPLFEDWAAPAAVFVLSGEMHGYVEPCGCSLNQLGGLSRRADLFRQIKDRNWPVTGLDTGGLVSNPGRRQAKIKMRMALDALHELQYAGIALGVEEVQIGIDLLQYAENERPPFLACNLVIGGQDIGTHVTKTVATVGAVKVGVTAVFGDSLAPRVMPQNAGQGGLALEVEVLRAVDALKKIIPELIAEKPDLLVLIAHARLAESKELAKQFPQFQLIVSAGGSEDPDPQPFFVGETLLVAPGQKGKHVGVVGYFPDEAGKMLRYEAVSLDGDRFQETPSMRDHMRRYQEALAVQELVSGEPRIEDPRNAQLAEANPYVGSKVCGECHKRTYEKWLATGHAKATQSIITGRHGQEATHISRIHDPECVACHATGWDTGRDDPKDFYGYKSGFVSESVTPHLTGQGCENCHGPGGRHTELERLFQNDGKETDELNRFRDFVQLQVDGIGAKLCVKCHDGDNDPHFKTEGDVFEEYWKKIAHPWRD